MTKGLLDRLYGDKVSIEYYDMSMPEDAAKQTELLSRVPGNRQFFPMVFIDGELKSVGSAEYQQILYLVREVINN
ncbi:MAG: glutaredoxin [Chloroflexi bacterium]|nr:glutaredoxin [Chloroflexota bacterium]